MYNCFIDSTASTLLVQELAPADVANIQEPSLCLTMPNGGNMQTETTMFFQLAKLPLQHDRLDLSDVGCTVIFQKHGVDI